MKALPTLLKDERGSMLPIMAAILLLSMGGAAVGVDLTRASAFRAELQTTADAAALAAATRLPNGDAAIAAALRYADKNMPSERYGEVLARRDVELGHWDAKTRSFQPNGSVPSAIRVTLRLASSNDNSIAPFFAGVFGVEVMNLSAYATAARQSAACVIALEPSSNHTMILDNNAQTEAQNCTVQVNSNKPNALRLLKSSSLKAMSICVAGGTQIHPHASASPEPTTGCPPIVDPLAGLPTPSYGSCDVTDAQHLDAAVTLSPGVYCGGLKIAGESDVTLDPGLYVIKDGPFSILDLSSVSGNGVTFYLTGSKSVLSFEDGTSLSLTAPSSGPLAGILFFQDRNFGGVHEWQSSAPAELQGTIYLPGGDLVSAGANAMTPLDSCTVLIANTIEFDADSGVSIDINGSGCRGSLPTTVLGTVALLE